MIDRHRPLTAAAPVCYGVVIMVYVIASIHVKQGSLEEYLAAIKENLPNVRSEEGCIQYQPCMDVAAGLRLQDTDQQRVTVVEQWESIEALQAHLAAPHMTAFREQVGGLIDGMSLQVVQEA